MFLFPAVSVSEPRQELSYGKVSTFNQGLELLLGTSICGDSQTAQNVRIPRSSSSPYDSKKAKMLVGNISV